MLLVKLVLCHDTAAHILTLVMGVYTPIVQLLVCATNSIGAVHTYFMATNPCQN